MSRESMNVLKYWRIMVNLDMVVLMALLMGIWVVIWGPFRGCVWLESNSGIIQGRLSDIYYMCEFGESFNVLRY